MKIALASLYLPSGSKIGVGYQVHYLANELVRRGHQVTVFSQSGRTEDSLYEVAIVPPRLRGRTFAFAWDLRRYDLSSFDVLHAHGDDWFLWGRRRPRHVHTFHGSCLAEMFNIRGLKEKARMGLLAACETQAVWMADETVAVSQATRRCIPGIRHVIPCGVDTRSLRPGTKSNHPTILFVGTMHGRKRGQKLFNDFTQHIRVAVPGCELWLVTETRVAAPGVRWFGRVDFQTLISLYQKAWIFSLPSTYEGFGVPYIEAMASGTPVVATRNVGVIEVTQGGRYGKVVTDDALAPTIIQLLNDEVGRSELADAGLRRSRQYGWETIAGRYEALYQSRN